MEPAGAQRAPGWTRRAGGPHAAAARLLVRGERTPPPELAAPTRASTIPSQGHPRRPARPRAAPGAGRASASAWRRGGDGAGTGCEGRRRRAGREAAGWGGRRRAEAGAAAEAGARAAPGARRRRGPGGRGGAQDGGRRAAGQQLGRAAAGRERPAPPRPLQRVPTFSRPRSGRRGRSGPAGPAPASAPLRPPGPARAPAGPAPSARPASQGPARPRGPPRRPAASARPGAVPPGGRGQGRRNGPALVHGAWPAAWGPRVVPPRVTRGHPPWQHCSAPDCEAVPHGGKRGHPTRGARRGHVGCSHPCGRQAGHSSGVPFRAPCSPAWGCLCKPALASSLQSTAALQT